jgi:hypothetical protein
VLNTTKGVSSYSLVSNLDPTATTDFALCRRTEPLVGVANFTGFDISGDSAAVFAPQPPKSPRRLGVVGDSITCGYGNEGLRLFLTRNNPPADERAT